MTEKTPELQAWMKLSGEGGRHRRGAHSRRRRSGLGRRRRGSRLGPPRRSSGARSVVLRSLAILLVVAVLAAVYVAVQLLRTPPRLRVQAVRSSFVVPGPPPKLPWPSRGSAALAVSGIGTVGTSGSPDDPRPIASITKVMTALVVLADHPLEPGQSGPSITVTPADVAQYDQDVAGSQSVLQVSAGEKLSELQALEGLLVASGNNIAQLLAVWDKGSQAAFVAAMNAEAARLGMTHSHFVDASGLNPGSVSTPPDLILLGEAAMANPVIAQIVRMPQATFPVAGTIPNFDYALGQDGIVGIKTGTDAQAGGCFLFDAALRVSGKRLQVIGAVLGQRGTPIIQAALNKAKALISAIRPYLARRTLLSRGQVVAAVSSRWGRHSRVVAARSFSVIAWPGMAVRASFAFSRLGSSVQRGRRVGTLFLRAAGSAESIPLLSASAVPGPGLLYRLRSL